MSWVLGLNHEITWSTEDFYYIDENDSPQPDSIKLEISYNGGSSWSTIIADTPNNGSYTWPVSGVTTDNAIIRFSGVHNTEITTETTEFSIIEVEGGFLWDFDDNGEIELTTSSSADYVYETYGLKHPTVTYNDIIYELDELSANPLPEIKFNGTPRLDEELVFYDNSKNKYIENTISYIIFNFGDGSNTVSGAPDDDFEYSFSAAGEYEIELSAFDISGNVGVDTRKIQILAGELSAYKSDYITVCGYDVKRFETCKNINLTEFLPDYLKNGEFQELIEVFENYLNDMYDGVCGFSTVETELSADYSSLRFDTPTRSITPKISILEKIKRIADLHDPSLIDNEYIQYFAGNLGYDIKINRSEFGSDGFENGVCSSSDQDKFLRFMITNLPNWNNIKTTNSMVKIMLYSFGLIGDIFNYYSDGNTFKLDDDNNLTNIQDNFYLTSHFAIGISINDISNDNPLDLTNVNKVIKAILSVQPLNTVFRGLNAKLRKTITLYVGGIVRLRRYIRISDTILSDELLQDDDVEEFYQDDDVEEFYQDN
jgi:hypothetical protein